jgi:putative two-component system response regulator
MTSAIAPTPVPDSDPAATAVLVVAGNDAIRAALRRILIQEKFSVQSIGSWPEALDTLRASPSGCVLLDLDAGLDDVADLGGSLRALDPDSALVLLASGDRLDQASRLAGSEGEVLAKPVDLADLVATVRHALRARDGRIASRVASARLQEEVALRTAELQTERRNLQRLSVATLESLVNALEAKDPHLRGHSARVADLAARVAEACGLPAGAVETVRVAGRLHDIGKIGIRENLLHKAGPLTEEEFAHVRTHVELGARILDPLPHLGDVISCVRHHHERWDGSGYPDGLRGDAIPIGARIIGAVETFDALTTSRPYQEMMSPDAAALRLRELAGTVLDPEVCEAVIRVVTGRTP